MNGEKVTVNNLGEGIVVGLNEPEVFEKMVFGNGEMRQLQDKGDLVIVTRDDCTVEGRACAVLTFTVEVDGKPARAQIVKSVRLLKMAMRVLDGRYDDDGKSYL